MQSSFPAKSGITSYVVVERCISEKNSYTGTMIWRKILKYAVQPVEKYLFTFWDWKCRRKKIIKVATIINVHD